MRFSAATPGRRRLLVWAAVAQAAAVVLALGAELASDATPVKVVAAVLAVLGIGTATLTVRAVLAEDRRRARLARDVIRLSSGMLMVLDRDGVVDAANPAACRVFGRAERELVGLPVWDVGFLPADRAASEAALREVLAGRVAMEGYRSERTIVVGGRRVVVAWTVAPIQDERGILTHLLVSGEDVTDSAEREERRRSDEADMAVLRGLTQDIAAHDDARGAVVERIRTLLDASTCTLVERRRDGSLAIAATTSDVLRPRELDAGEASAVMASAAAGERLFVTDSGTLGAELGHPIECASLHYEPVAESGEVIGVLLVGWSAPVDALDERHGQLLTIAASETAIAIRRAETLNRLETLAMTDALTGVANRRAFDAELTRAVARHRRDGSPLCLIVLDLNEFKALNDREGHDVGDALLCGSVGAWEAQLRTGDLLARLGGDEFAVLLPGCAPEFAEMLVRRLRDATPHGPGTSAGYAILSDETPEELYAQADRALYRDKRARRASRVADPARLAAVEATGLWEGGRSPELDRLAAEVGDLIDCPGTYVTLVGRDRLVYAAKPEAEPEDGRAIGRSFCQHAVATGRPFIVEDSREEALTAGSAGSEEGLIAYAGMPVADADGNVLGALCACDTDAREWSPAELRVLDRYATRVAEQLSRDAQRVGAR